jgi:CheY-like chemotaxis protein
MPGQVLGGDRINLERISFLLVDENQTSLDITAGVVAGFGVRSITKCQSVRDAKDVLRKGNTDFIIADAQLPEEDGYSFLEWVRRETEEPTRFVPAIIIVGHTKMGDVFKARDCGAHFIVTKPLTPRVLLDRIFWVARDERLFIDCETYVGPDRRFKRLGPPVGTSGRRADDLSGKVGSAKEPNLSQDEINDLMRPAKVQL